MVRKSGFALLVVCAASLSYGAATPAVAQTTPPYQIILRSRSGEVAPVRIKDGQTGGGYIEVVQRQSDQVTIMMRGAVVAGTEQYKGGEAEMRFILDQDFEVVATRPGLRPPRLILVGQVIGTLMSTFKAGGNADQGPACAAVNSAGQPVLKFCLKPHSVTCGQKLFVNDREGPFEMTVAPGAFCLHETFELSASQPPVHCHLGEAAAAVFDPAPGFDARFNHVLRPFRSVPAKDFGFGVLLRVVEEPPPPANGGTETLPPPRRERTNRTPPVDVIVPEEHKEPPAPRK